MAAQEDLNFKISDIPLLEKKDKHGRKIGEDYKIVGVREAVKILSVGNGQGFLIFKMYM